ncbi:hypothetical protein MKZ38_002370 [Zalerion maritima]|uniref:Uncharacterized protein n=1 Tax=Zalerion maritima TaxID=339359 RepID=A0AAD5RYH3_9PEZI|nr:hypothetical protein MKZ38_002370 [Zalerion maritima]
MPPQTQASRYRKAHETGWRVLGPVHLVRKLSLPIPVVAVICSIQARGAKDDYHYAGGDPFRWFWFMPAVTVPPCGLYLLYNLIYLIALRPSLERISAVVKKVQDPFETVVISGTAVCMVLAAVRLTKPETTPFHAAAVALLAVQMVVASLICGLRKLKGVQM